MLRMLAGLLLAVALPAVAQEGGPTLDVPLAQRRPPDTSLTPPHLRLAKRVTVPCGPRAAQAHVALATAGRVGKLTLEEFAALRELGASDEAAQHPVLVAMALAVALEHELALDEVTPARREALLDVLLSQTIPLPACLKPSTIQGVRFRTIAEACTTLERRRVEVKDWALSPARVYLLMLHRTGEDITEDCRALLRTELGAPDEGSAIPVLPAPGSTSP